MSNQNMKPEKTEGKEESTSHTETLTSKNGWLRELVIAIMSAILGATLGILLGPLPYRFVILIAVASVVVGVALMWRCEYYQKILKNPVFIPLSSLAIGAVFGFVVATTFNIFWPVSPPPSITPTVTDNAGIEVENLTQSSPCPTFPITLPDLSPITMDNISALKEMDHMDISRVLAVTLSGDGRWLAVANTQKVPVYMTGKQGMVALSYS